MPSKKATSARASHVWAAKIDSTPVTPFFSLPNSWTDRFLREPLCSKALRRLEEAGCNRDYILMCLYLRRNQAMWDGYRSSHDDFRRAVKRLQGRVEYFDPQVVQQIFRHLPPPRDLYSFSDSVLRFRKWFDEAFRLNKSRRANFHQWLSPLIDHLRVNVRHKKRESAPAWPSDLVTLVEGLMMANKWTSKPRITVDSIRRFVERSHPEKKGTVKPNVTWQ